MEDTGATDWRNEIGGLISGNVVTRVALDQYNARLVIAESELVMEGKWTLGDDSGRIIDESIACEARIGFELWRVVGRTAVAARVPVGVILPYIEVEFDSGLVLRAMSDDTGYENWSVSTKGRIIVCRGQDVEIY
jgi:hypothetical protein